jgi:hypothetical protein
MVNQKFNMKLACVFLLCFILNVLFAQNTDSINQRRFEFNSFDLGPSFQITSAPVFSMEVYKGLILSNDFPVENTSGFGVTGKKSNNFIPLFNASLGFHLKNSQGKKKFGNPIIRIGFGFGESEITRNTLSKNSRNTIDSIFVSSTNSVQPIDSTSRESVFFKINSNLLYFNSMFLFQTNPDKKMCFYGGIGFGFGFSVYSNIHYNYSLRWRKEHPIGAGTQQLASGEILKKETERMLPYQFYSLSLPVGFDIRFATYTRFWRNIHVFFEIAPLFQYSIVQNHSVEPRNGVYFSFGGRFRVFDKTIVR